MGGLRDDAGDFLLVMGVIRSGRLARALVSVSGVGVIVTGTVGVGVGVGFIVTGVGVGVGPYPYPGYVSNGASKARVSRISTAIGAILFVRGRLRS